MEISVGKLIINPIKKLDWISNDLTGTRLVFPSPDQEEIFYEQEQDPKVKEYNNVTLILDSNGRLDTMVYSDIRERPFTGTCSVINTDSPNNSVEELTITFTLGGPSPCFYVSLKIN